MITVQKLIAKLKKMPPRAIVAWADHDHNDNEINGFVGQVLEASEYLKKERGVGVIIRP
jgi:hypothetical protein